MRRRILAVTFITCGLLILLHHFYVTGKFFDLKDILNHEFLVAIFLTAGLVLLLSSPSYKQ